jgi:hypothetical protein
MLTGVWLVGVAMILEYWDTSLWLRVLVAVLLLGAVGLVELVFVRWNTGRWPLQASRDDRNESNPKPARRVR